MIWSGNGSRRRSVWHCAGCSFFMASMKKTVANKKKIFIIEHMYGTREKERPWGSDEGAG